MYSVTAKLNSRASVGKIALVMLFALIAMFFGLVAVSSNLILVGLAAGALIGIALLSRPIWTIWMVFVLGLLVAGILPLFIDSMTGKAVWGVSILGFMLLFVSLGKLVTEKDAGKGAPYFVWVAMVFILYLMCTAVLQYSDAYESFSGLKRYFQATGLLFAFAWLSISEENIRRWRIFFLLLALVQLPWAIYERIVLMPIREGLHAQYPLMVPFDVVAGTFGASLYEGGGNAEMAAFLVIVLAFLMTRWREKIITTGKFITLSIIVLAPLFLGETKIVIIILPVVFLVVFRQELLARPHVALFAGLVGLLITILAGMAYVSINKQPLSKEIEETINYNFRDQGHGGWVLNRTKVLTFWAEHQSLNDPVSTVIGNGIGSAHDKTMGHISKKYPGYGIGLTAASSLLWESGIVGSALFMLMLYLAWKAARRLKTSSKLAWIRADSAAIEATMPIFVIYVFYRLTLLEHLAFQVIFYTIIGYLAWLVKYNHQLPRTGT